MIVFKHFDVHFSAAHEIFVFTTNCILLATVYFATHTPKLPKVGTLQIASNVVRRTSGLCVVLLRVSLSQALQLNEDLFNEG